MARESKKVRRAEAIDELDHDAAELDDDDDDDEALSSPASDVVARDVDAYA